MELVPEAVTEEAAEQFQVARLLRKDTLRTRENGEPKKRP